MKSLLKGGKEINSLFKEISLKVADVSHQMGKMKTNADNPQSPVFRAALNLYHQLEQKLLWNSWDDFFAK